IRKVTLGRDSVIFSGYLPPNFAAFYSKENNNIKLNKPIAYSNNSIGFTFVSNSYQHADIIAYSTMLEGFDRQWSEWNKQTERNYTNLPEGKYVFKVKGKLGNQEEYNISSYEFVILPPIYRTWWAILLYFVLAAAFFIISIELYTRRLRNANLKLENTIENRTKQISEQNFEIKEQAKLLERTNKELEKLSIVADKTTNAVIITDHKGNIEWLNNGFKEMFDYDLEEFTTTFGNCLLNTTNPSYVNKILLSAIRNKTNVNYEMKLTSKKGKEMWIHANITPITDSNNRLQKLIVIDSDITALKKAERETQIQKEILEEQNKYITAGIEYAKTIQQASLPLKSVTDAYFDSFLLYKPKDVVSGDFYWFTHIEATKRSAAKTIVAVVDCTGHGVPGAFMSLIGSRLLSVIVNERRIVAPGKILENLDREINIALMQAQTDNADGMDVCLCCIEHVGNNAFNLTFAGAKRPLYYTANSGMVHTIKGSRRRIGGKKTLQSNLPFEETTIEITTDTLIYLTTDGFIDQNSADRTRFGTRNFLNNLQQGSKFELQKQKETLFSALSTFQASEEQRDDITILGIRMKKSI
ncbi:MAG TPA: hypothetical protein DCQ31_19395, partial [Bacteroidales bacterium]|nr:hypothetical protein [Bacteroidales bacterium]